MTIDNKNWRARDDRMPGVNTFTVTGIVPTSASNDIPTLALSGKPSAAGQLNLELSYSKEGFGLQVLGEARVTYAQPSDATITTVHVYQNDQLLVCIDDVEVTH
ncbi:MULTISPECIES: hypothetical protein [Pseudomonas syringae group]|uniref:hypothetical protein n=1 Tax=Pseudomonas syringae group TaxID=136849 RepID=UPI000F044C69|nr:hypothetical protein [Pseudomonas viridiflava]MBD8569968.1 hypothetical protein [Pseudomonas syringae]MCI3910355.1 hypothetical protein [Pseudomonas viridiflava]MEE4078037.1 hypothetical protein [Pseudomonas viridiflava]MEE4086630.1 hypothetical protein [Pseudomonas viridiflava]MEE4138963.1 hypothetical protein [Pseudomonas viridiflava]